MDLKKNVSAVLDERGGVICIGDVTTVLKPGGGGVSLAFRGDIEVRIIFSLGQAEQMLKEYDGQLNPSQVADVLQHISQMRWAKRSNPQAACRLRGESAMVVFNVLVRPMVDPSLRCLVSVTDGNVGRFVFEDAKTPTDRNVSGPLADVIPIDGRSKKSPDIQ